jgi:hypothetical protein
MLQDVTTDLDLGHDINGTIGFIETKFPDILLNVRGDNAKASPRHHPRKVYPYFTAGTGNDEMQLIG